MAKKIKEDPNRKVKELFLTTEEKEHLQNIQSTHGILAILRHGLDNSMYIEIERYKHRLGITHVAPEGFERKVDFDPHKYAFLVIDTKIEKKEEKADETPSEAKN